MKYNIEESLTFVKNDKNWGKKLMIGTVIGIVAGLFFFLPSIVALITKIFNPAVMVEIVICWIIAGILCLGLSGYCIKACHERIFYRDAQLPEWNDFGGLIFLGFKSVLGSFMLYLPIIAIGLVAGMYEGFGSSANKLAANYVGTMGISSIVNIIYNVLYFVFTLFYFAFNANFLKDFNIFSYLNYAAAYRRINDNLVQYAILVAMILAVGFIFNTVIFVLCVSVAGLLAVPFAVLYMQLITLDLTAQFIRISENKQ